MTRLFLPAAILGVIFFYLWPGTFLLGHRHWVGAVVIWFTLALCLEYNRRFSPGLREWGLSWRDAVPALRLCLVATIPVILLILLVSLSLDTFIGRRAPFLDLLGLFSWGLAQQFALQTVILRECRQYWNGRWAAAATAAVIFGIIHLPNPFLVPLTFAGAWYWCWVFQRHPFLPAVALSHALLSLTLLASFPRALTGGMRVGYSYLLP